jgi:hypothetical protein
VGVLDIYGELCHSAFAQNSWLRNLIVIRIMFICISQRVSNIKRAALLVSCFQFALRLDLRLSKLFLAAREVP